MKEEFWVAQDRISGWQIVSGPYSDEPSALDYVTSVGPSRFKVLKSVKNVQTIVKLMEDE